MTNREKLSALTDQELAAFLADDDMPEKINRAVCDGEGICPITRRPCGAEIFGADCQVRKMERFVYWLGMPAEK